MYKPIPGGSEFEISFPVNEVEEVVYTVHLPPVGYVHNLITDRMERRPVLFKDKKKKDQMWERTELPADWKKRRREEANKKKVNPEYYDEELQKFINQEWDRRINGVWMMIDGEEVYLTGEHYFYCNWMRMDFGYPDFRFIDLEYFYIWQYCIEDPKCYGLNVVAPRRTGKTARFGVAMLNLPSMTANCFAGFQSKTYPDAGKVFRQSVVLPFKNLPSFFQPIRNYDSKMAKSIEFVASLPTGKKAMDMDDIEEGLDSFIDYKDSGAFSYDGYKLQRYGMDESGKTKEVSVYERYQIVKPCMEVGDDIIGKCLSTTTVEVDDEFDVSYDFIKLTNESDIRKREEDGQTKSGLYTYFMAVFKTLLIDKYGRSLEKEAKEKISLRLKKYENDEVELIKQKRKYPSNLDEALMTSVKDCPFNLEILNRRDRQLENMNPTDLPYTVGDFVWEKEWETVKFVPNPKNGKWHVSWLPHKTKQNKIKSSRGQYFPDNDHMIVSGVDPINYGGSSASAGKSSIACVIERLPDLNDNPDMSDNYVADYFHRPEDPDEAYEDIFLACWFYGCKIHIENQKFDIGNWLKKNNGKHFVMTRPSNTVKIGTKKKPTEDGTPAGSAVIDLYVKLLKKRVQNHGHRINHPRIIKQMMGFTVKGRTKFDLVVAAGFAEIAADAPYEAKKDNIDITGLFNLYGENFE